MSRLIANLSSGITLSYAISGTPTVTSPTTTTFVLNIGGQTCSAVVGGGDVIQPGQLIYYCSADVIILTFYYQC